MPARHAPPDPGAAVCRAFGPVLEPRGFAAGQVGSSEHEVEVTFCAPARAVRDRFGGLSGWAQGDPEPETWECTDLVVVVGVDAERVAYLDQVRLDGRGLDRLLQHVDRHDLAPEAAGLDRPRDLSWAQGAGALSFGWGTSGPRPLSSLGATGPLGRLPLDAALARAAELLDVVLDEAELHPVWWDAPTPDD